MTDRTVVGQLPAYLHPGEREAIVLAQELGAQLFIDERRGRNAARERGITVLGVFRLLAEAKRLSLVGQVKPILDAILTSGYWINEELIPLFLQEVGESDK